MVKRREASVWLRDPSRSPEDVKDELNRLLDRGVDTPGGQQVEYRGVDTPGEQQVQYRGVDTPGGQQVQYRGVDTPGGQQVQNRTG